MPFYAQHIKAARLHLMKSDPRMKKLIKRVGPFTAKTKRDRFEALVSSIISQQISVTAASSIKRRLYETLGESGVTPDHILQLSANDLCDAGLSRPKAAYVLDLAERVSSGDLQLASLQKFDDDAVIKQLTQVKGIGTWTAQIFLMFSLGRMDILPTDDLGLRASVKQTYELDARPDGPEFEKIAQAWRPHATVACWYLWQGLELDETPTR